MKSRSIREVYPTFGPDHLLGPEVRYPHNLKCWCQPELVTPCQQCTEPAPRAGLVVAGASFPCSTTTESYHS
jgi:hypothetical protein